MRRKELKLKECPTNMKIMIKHLVWSDPNNNKSSFRTTHKWPNSLCVEGNKNLENVLQTWKSWQNSWFAQFPIPSDKTRFAVTPLGHISFCVDQIELKLAEYATEFEVIMKQVIWLVSGNYWINPVFQRLRSYFHAYYTRTILLAWKVSIFCQAHFFHAR